MQHCLGHPPAPNSLTAPCRTCQSLRLASHLSVTPASCSFSCTSGSLVYLSSHSYQSQAHLHDSVRTCVSACTRDDHFSLVPPDFTRARQRRVLLTVESSTSSRLHFQAVPSPHFAALSGPQSMLHAVYCHTCSAPTLHLYLCNARQSLQE